MPDLFTYRQEHNARLKRHAEATTLHAELLDQYTGLLDQHQEHQGLGETKEAKELQPSIQEARADLEKVEIELSQDGDEEMAAMAQAALEDGAERFQACADRQNELLGELEKVKAVYLEKLREIHTNQHAAAKVVVEKKRINQLVPKEIRAHLRGLRMPTPTEIEISEHQYEQTGSWPMWALLTN